MHGRFNIVFVMEDHGIKSHPISKFIEHASELDTVFLFFESKLPLLPLYCSRIIDIFDHESAMLYDSQNKMEKKYFEYESVSDDRLQNAVQILAPVECEEISLAGTLRKNISLFELLGINSVAGLNLSERWHAYDGTATGTEKDDLFKLSVSASADAGGSFAIYSESKKAIETDLININATSFKIKGSFLAGGCIQVTVPTPYFKWPW